MAKRFDYYAGYPGQQRTPKWVGVALGSLFGGMTILALALGIRLVMPPRAAQASIAPKPVGPSAEAPLLAPTTSSTPVAAQVAAPAPSEVAATPRSTSRHDRALSKHGKKKGGKGARMMAAADKPRLDKTNPRYKKAQLYAKSVSGSRRDKRARDDLDKMLGL